MSRSLLLVSAFVASLGATASNASTCEFGSKQELLAYLNSANYYTSFWFTADGQRVNSNFRFAGTAQNPEVWWRGTQPGGTEMGQWWLQQRVKLIDNQSIRYTAGDNSGTYTLQVSKACQLSFRSSGGILGRK